MKVSPSILAADFNSLGDEVKKLEQAGADYIHVDVMDGVFVPNITIGQQVVESIKKVTSLPLDVHLMISNPDDRVQSFIDAGSDILTVHFEACVHPDRVLSQIKKAGIKAGIALLPSTNELVLDYILHQLDSVLIMSVNPGFGGQSFLESQIAKVQNIRSKIDTAGVNTELSIDGGITDKTLPKVAKYLDVCVAGTYVFSGDYQTQINNLKRIANGQ